MTYESLSDGGFATGSMMGWKPWYWMKTNVFVRNTYAGKFYRRKLQSMYLH